MGFRTGTALLGAIALGLLTDPDAARGQCLLDTIAVPMSQFGSTVAFDGAHAIGGAPASAAAVIYANEPDGWAEAGFFGGAGGSEYGASVALDGTAFVVGAPLDDDAGLDAGALHVYRYDGTGWSLEEKLTSATAIPGDELGRAVAIQGSRIVAGAPGSNRAVIFERGAGAWSETEVLTASASGESFGAAVSLEDRVIAIGAPALTTGVDPRAFVFRRTGGTWTEVASITGSDTATGDEFGRALSLSAARLAVGAPEHDAANGAVYLFVDAGPSWIPQGSIDGTGSFGASVSLDGDAVLVGAPADGTSGRAYLHRRDDVAGAWPLVDTIDPGGSEVGSGVTLWGALAVTGAAGSEKIDISVTAGPPPATFLSSIPRDFSLYGGSIDQWGDRVIVGAASDRGLVSTTGAVYVYRAEGDGWVEEQKLFAADGESGDRYGRSVSIHGPWLMVGANQKNPSMDPPPESAEGRAYIYRRDGTTWTESASLLGSDAAGQFHRFGLDVLIRDRFAFATALLDDELRGAVYVFEYDGFLWSEVQKLTASDGETNDQFGGSLSVDGDRLLIGASAVTASGGLNSAGKVYAFEYDGTVWVEVQSFQEVTPEGSANFGTRLDQCGGWAVVGASRADFEVSPGVVLTDSGSVTTVLHDGDGWAIETEFVPEFTDAGESVISVRIEGGRIAVAQPRAVIGGSTQGTVSTLRREGSSWVGETRLQPRVPNPVLPSNFGNGLDLHRGSVGIGTPFSRLGSLTPGRAERISFTAALCQASFTRGDANVDGGLDVADVITVLDYLFAGGAVDCVDALDANANTDVSITDAFRLLGEIFTPDSIPLPHPYLECGRNLYDLGLGCDTYGVCP